MCVCNTHPRAIEDKTQNMVSEHHSIMAHLKSTHAQGITFDRDMSRHEGSAQPIFQGEGEGEGEG
jgi:hypothetical protein